MEAGELFIVLKNFLTGTNNVLNHEGFSSWRDVEQVHLRHVLLFQRVSNEGNQLSFVPYERNEDVFESGSG